MSDEKKSDPVHQHAEVPTAKNPQPQTHKELALETVRKAAEVEAETKNLAKLLAQETDNKAEALAKASNLLSERILTLSKVVQTNNLEILKMRKELDRKPDDSEVQFMTQMAHEQKWRNLRRNIISVVASAFIAGVLSFGFAQHESIKLNQMRIATGHKTCEETNHRLDGAKVYYEGLIEEEKTNPFIDNVLRERRINRTQSYLNALLLAHANCDKRFPL